MNTYTVKQSGGSQDSVVAGSVHYGADWVKFYKEPHAGRELEPIYSVHAGAVVSIHQEGTGVSTSRDDTEVEIPILMCRTVLSASSTTKYTAPADSTIIVKEIVLTNSSTSKPAQVTVTLNNIPLLSATPLPVSSVTTITLGQVMAPGEILEAAVHGSDPAPVSIHVSGTEIRRTGAAPDGTTMTVTRAATDTQEELIVKTRRVVPASNIPVPDPTTSTKAQLISKKKQTHLATTAKLEAEISELQAKIAQNNARYTEDQTADDVESS